MATKDPTFAPPLNELLTANPVLTGNNVIQAASIQGYPSDPTRAMFGDGTWKRVGMVPLFDSDYISVAKSSFLVTALPGFYTHLHMRWHLRGDTAATSINANVIFQGDQAPDYDIQQLSGSGAAAAANEFFGQTSLSVPGVPAASDIANLYQIIEMDLFFYASLQNKVMAIKRWDKLGTVSGNMAAALHAGFWRSNTPITSITVTASTGNFAAGSRVMIYGIP